MRAKPFVEVKGLSKLEATKTLFVSGNLYLSGTLYGGNISGSGGAVTGSTNFFTNNLLDSRGTLDNTTGNLILSASTSQITVSGNLNILGTVTATSGLATSPITGSTDFFTINRLDSQGVLLNSSGSLILSSSNNSKIFISGNLFVPVNSKIQFEDSTVLSATLNGKLKISNAAATTGEVLDTTSAGILKIRNVADSDYDTTYSKNVHSIGGEIGIHNGVGVYDFDASSTNNNLEIGSDWKIIWADSPTLGTYDTGIIREKAAVVKITGSSGTGSLIIGGQVYNDVGHLVLSSSAGSIVQISGNLFSNGLRVVSGTFTDTIDTRYTLTSSFDAFTGSFSGSVKSIGDTRYIFTSSATATPTANSVVRSPVGSQYLNTSWLGSGVGSSTNFLRGDGSWQSVSSVQPNSFSVSPFTGQTSVNVVHGFGAFPVVQVVDAAGAILIPQSIIHNTVNDFTVTFVNSTSGNILATIGSPQPQAFVATSINYTVLSTDRIVKATGASITITLPTAAGNTGREYVIDNASTGNVTVVPSGSQTIESETSQILTVDSAMSIYSDGSNWRIY